MTDGHSKQLLVSAIRFVKGQLDEIAGINEVIAERCKDARDQGFDSGKIREVARWLRKVEKHGRDKMDEAEAIFDLYRSVVDTGGADLDTMMDDARDRALLKMFAGEDQVEKKLSASRKRVSTALALAQASKAAREAAGE